MPMHANDAKGRRVATATAADTAAPAAPPAPPPAASTCPRCGKQFKNYQSRNAHLQFCKVTTANPPAAALPADVQASLRRSEAALANNNSAFNNLPPVAALPADVQASLRRSEAALANSASAFNNLGVVEMSIPQPQPQTTNTNENILPPQQQQISNREQQQQQQQQLKKKSTKITKKQKDLCFKFFAEQKYSRNENLPTGQHNKVFLDFLKNNNLNRDQAKRQLDNWKDIKYDYYGQIITSNADERREIMLSHLPDDPSDFLKTVLGKMAATNDGVLKENNWYNAAAKKHPYIDKHLTNMMVGPFKDIFLSILDRYVEIAVSVFPEQAKNCGNTDMTFYNEKETMVHKTFDDKFYEKVQLFDDDLNLENIGDTKKEQRERFRMWKVLYIQIEEKMYYDWCRTSCIDELPPIKIVLDDSISKYSENTLYYTAGCILKGIGKAIKVKTRAISLFVSSPYAHSIGVERAEHDGLPFRLTQVSSCTIIPISKV